MKLGNVVPCKYVSASSLAPNLIRKVIFFSLNLCARQNDLEHTRMPISSLSSQRNLNRMLLKTTECLKTTEFRRKRFSLFLQLCTDLENNMLYFKFRN